MNTDIRTLIAGLRPVAHFISTAERTAEILSSRAQDVMCDEQEVAELNELADFWSTVAERVQS